MSRHKYPLDLCRVFERTTITKVQEVLASKIPPEASKKTPKRNEHMKHSEVGDIGPDMHKAKQKRERSRSAGKPKTGTYPQKLTFKFALGEALGYGPGILEHIILDAGLAPNVKFTKHFKLDENALQALLKSIEKFEDWMEDVIKGDKIPEGYILMKRKVLGEDSSTSDSETQNSNQVLYLSRALIFSFKLNCITSSVCAILLVIGILQSFLCLITNVLLTDLQ